MRNFLSAFIFLFCFSFVNAQNEKGFSVEKKNVVTSVGKTYALIIGISKYHNPYIPQLQFADKDAIAFNKYLIENGVDSSNIRLLLNDEAGSGDIMVGISDLIDSAKAGDRVYFYFSGHGDVESKSLMRDAYLLPYDSPNKMYSTGSIHQLQGLFGTISSHGAQVIFICDACHSGKLAGGIDGMHAAAAAFGDIWKDEIKILSCNPGEMSLEGEQWGNGRGLFSYELINGLTGLADKNGDGKILLRELNFYLGEKVPEEAGTIHQNPIVLGEGETEMAKTNPEMLKTLLANAGAKKFSSVDTKGMEELLVSVQSDSIKKYHELFQKSIHDGYLSAHGNFKTGAFQYLNKIPVNDSTKMMLGIMKRNLAAKIINKINYFIDYSLNNQGYDNYGFAIYYTYSYEEELTVLVGKEKLEELGLTPRLNFMKLLSNDNVFINPLPESFAMLDSILSMEPKATYALSLYAYLLAKNDSMSKARDLALKVIDIAPSFVFSYRLLSEIYLQENKLDSSLFYARKIIEIDSSFLSSASFLLSLNYFFLGKNDSSYYYFNQYKVNLRTVMDCWNCELVGLYASKMKLEKPEAKEPEVKEHGTRDSHSSDKKEESFKISNSHLIYNEWNSTKDSATFYMYQKYNLIQFVSSNNGILEDRAMNLEENENESFNQMYFAPATIKFSPENYFRLACFFSSVNYLKKSFEYLEKALESGYTNIESLKNNKELYNVRNHPQFAEFVDSYLPGTFPDKERK